MSKVKNQKPPKTTLDNAKRNTHQGQGKLSSRQIINNAKNELCLEGLDSNFCGLGRTGH